MTTTRRHPLTDVICLLAGATAAIVLLHGLADQPWAVLDVTAPVAWASATAPEDAVVAVARLAALACAYWLLVTTLACVAATSRGAPRTVLLLRAAAPRAVRTLVQRSLAGAVAGGVLLSAVPAMGSPPPPGVLPPTTPQTDTVVQPDASGDVPADVPPPPMAGGGTHTVVAGDNFWRIAAAEVGRRTATDPDIIPASEVAPYWLRVVEENRDRIRSGDPDLIFPGETLVLPD